MAVNWLLCCCWINRSSRSLRSRYFFSWRGGARPFFHDWISKCPCGDFGSRSWISPGRIVMLSSKLFPDYPGRVASAILGQRERMKRRTWFQSNRTLIFQCGASGFYTCHKGPALKANTALPVTCRQKQSNKNCRPPAVTRSRRRGQPKFQDSVGKE